MILLHSWKTICYAVAISTATASSSFATEPLHARIDTAIGFGNAEFEAIVADDAGDATFVRRIYLDLAGTIPSVSY